MAWVEVTDTVSASSYMAARRTATVDSQPVWCVAGLRPRPSASDGTTQRKCISSQTPTVESRGSFFDRDSVQENAQRRRSVLFGLLSLDVARTGHSSTRTLHPDARTTSLASRTAFTRLQNMAAVLSFAESGRGFSHNLTLEAVANTAIELGFEKDGPQSSSKKPAQRADLQRFFKAYGVKAFSPFREKFEKEKLLPPEEYAALKVAQEIEAKENEFAPVTEQQYVEATQTADTLEKKWRLFKK